MKVLLTCLLVLLAPVAWGQSMLFQVQARPVSWVHFCDLHAGQYLSGVGFSNMIEVLIASNAAWNLKFAVFSGDIWDNANTNSSEPWYYSTNGNSCGYDIVNQYGRHLQTNGITPIFVAGNHDKILSVIQSDVPSNLTNCISFESAVPLSFYTNAPADAGYFTSRLGTTSDVAWKYNDGNARLLFIGIAWWGGGSTNSGAVTNMTQLAAIYQPSLTWASGLIAANPTYHVILVAHYIIDANGIPNYDDNGNGAVYVNEGPGRLLWNTCVAYPNVTLFLSGHVKGGPELCHTNLVGSGGRYIHLEKFGHPNGGANHNGAWADNSFVSYLWGGSVVLYTYDPTHETVHYRTMMGGGYDHTGVPLSAAPCFFTNQADVPFDNNGWFNVAHLP